MWIALLVIMISIFIMFLIAWKWNISNRSILIGAVIIALTASIPFLWVYHHYKSGWLLIISVAGQIGLSLIIALALVLYRFSRDPERLSPQEEGVIVSPADGEVVYIMTVPTGTTPMVTKNGRDYFLQELAGIELVDYGMLIVGIEMNILNVHVNRCPIEGEAKFVKHIHGGFLSLRKKEAPFINARCTTLITNEVLTVSTVQIASRLVRRVDNYLQAGQTVKLGQRLGMIRFGSLVAAIFPDREDIKIEVHIGQKVLAGTSILAHYR
jgi:phosphatidylserine decarboxylase